MKPSYKNTYELYLSDFNNDSNIFEILELKMIESLNIDIILQ